MGFLQLFILASLSWPGFSQTCPAMELSFILDLSYNARLASTNFVNFDILEDQLRKIFNDSVLYNSANISVEAFGYNDNPYEIIPYWSSLSNASSYLSILQRIRILNTSTTLNGLGKMTVGPRYNDSIIFLVTSQGSNGSLLTLTAIEYAKILKNRGWNIRVIALKSVNDFNILELQGIDANYVTVSTLPKSYLGLADAVIGIVEQRCLKYVSAAASTTTTTLSSTASLTTTTLSSTEPITTTTPSTSESSLATALPATTTISPPTPPTATTLTSQSTTTTITSTPESTTTTSTTLPVTTTTTSTPFPSLITTISTSSPPIITTISTPSPTTSITTMTPSPTTTTAPPTTTTLTPSSTTTTAPTTTTTSTQSTTTTTTTLTPELTTTTAPTTTTTSLTPESISTTSPTSTSTSAPTTTPTSTFTTTTTTLTTTKPSTTTMSSSTTTQISTIQLTTASPTNATSISTAMLTTTPTTTTTIPSTAPTTTSPPSTTTSISTTTPGTSTSLPTTTTSPTTTAPITTTSTQSSTTLLSTTTAPSSTKILSTSTALVSTTTSPTTNTTSAITTPTSAASITTPLPTTTTTSSASQSPTTTTTLSIPSTTFSTRILTTSWSPPNETQSTTSAPVGTPTSKVCGKMQLLFLLDLSQVAYMSATSRSDRTLDILENQLKLIFIYLSLYPRVQIRVEVIGYSANGSIHILPHWTAPSKASKKLWKLKQFPNTDAWSSSGFTNIHSRPKYVNNILFYVTSQTTNNDTNRDQTLEDVNRVKAMGWNVRVFALKTSSSVIDLNELADLDKSFITISDEPKCYTGLSREVTKILKSVCKEFNSETLPPCKTKGRKSRAHQD